MLIPLPYPLPFILLFVSTFCLLYWPIHLHYALPVSGITVTNAKIFNLSYGDPLPSTSRWDTDDDKEEEEKKKREEEEEKEEEEKQEPQ